MNTIEGLERLPFQLQVQYTDVKGAQYLRVITLDKPVTRDRKFAEQREFHSVYFDNVLKQGSYICIALQSKVTLFIDIQILNAAIWIGFYLFMYRCLFVK